MNLDINVVIVDHQNGGIQKRRRAPKMAPSSQSLGLSDAQVTSHRMPIVARYTSGTDKNVLINSKNTSLPLASTLLKVDEDIPMI